MHGRAGCIEEQKVGASVGLKSGAGTALTSSQGGADRRGTALPPRRRHAHRELSTARAHVANGAGSFVIRAA
jgi:hypothetical protein